MTTPTLFATGVTADSVYTAPGRTDGVITPVVRQATVPAGTANGAVIGLIPFRKGMRIMPSTRAWVTDNDTATTATIDFGYVYVTGSAATDDPDAFVAASGTVRTGGQINFDSLRGAYTFVAEDDGFIMARIGGEAVEVEFTIDIVAGVFYAQ